MAQIIRFASELCVRSKLQTWIFACFRASDKMVIDPIVQALYRKETNKIAMLLAQRIPLLQVMFMIYTFKGHLKFNFATILC